MLHDTFLLTYRVDAPFQETRLPVSDSTPHAFLQLIEGRAFDGNFIARQLYNLASHHRQLGGGSFVAGLQVRFLAECVVEKQIFHDDSEAVDVCGASWLGQSAAVSLDLRCQVSERARKVVLVSVNELQNTLLASGLVAAQPTHDVVQCRVLPVDDLDVQTRVHVAFVDRQVAMNQTLSMKVRHSVGDVGAHNVAERLVHDMFEFWSNTSA